MNDLCVEDCAIKRDCSHFKPKRIPLDELPPYPEDQARQMSRDEKYTAVSFYISRFVDHLQGRENGRDNDYSRSGVVFEAFKGKALLHGSTKADPPPENGAQRPDQEEQS
jgi:hypothetical protein